MRATGAVHADAAAQAKLLAQMQRWNRTYNLTAIRDPQQMLIQHLFDSYIRRRSHSMEGAGCSGCRGKGLSSTWDRVAACWRRSCDHAARMVRDH